MRGSLCSRRLRASSTAGSSSGRGKHPEACGLGSVGPGYHSATFAQPGNGPTSSFQPEETCSSRTTRRLVRDSSLAISSSRGGVWSGCLDRSGIGHSRIFVPSPPDAIQRPSGEMARLLTSPSCPYRRCGSDPSTEPTRMTLSPSLVTMMVPVGSMACLRLDARDFAGTLSHGAAGLDSRDDGSQT